MPPLPHDGNVTGFIATIDRSGAQAALAWWLSAGVDVAVGDAPRNWLEAPAPPPVRVAVSAAAPVQAKPAATSLVAGIDDLDALTAAVAAFDHPLRRAGIAPCLVDGSGSRGALVVTDMPDLDDAPAARLAERMLAAIGFPAGAARIARLVPWPTTGGRAVNPDQVAAFAPFTRRLIELARPRAILAFGAAAASLSDEPGGINSLRGRWLTDKASGVPLLATFHPRALLNHPELKRLAWADLQTFAQRIDA